MKWYETIAPLMCFVVLITSAATSYAQPPTLDSSRFRDHTNLFPTQPVPVADIVYISQDDSIWAHEKMLPSKTDISSSGCLVACVASVLHELDSTINPYEVNQLFCQNGVYSPRGYILWDKLETVLPQFKVVIKDDFDSQTIMNDLMNGELPIVKLNLVKTGIFHWVVIVGANEEHFMIMDPFNETHEFFELNKFRSKATSYRKIVYR